LRRDAERFHDKEAALAAKLKGAGPAPASSKAGEENVVLSDKDRQAIDKFRAELLVTRRGCVRSSASCARISISSTGR
jgi:hypothetical protein